MAQPSTLYRFKLDLSDISRGVYENFEFRIAMHPSETSDYLLTRVIAFALNFDEGVEFSSQGLSSPEEPAISKRGIHGNLDLWIEIGNPSAKKIHKASKAAKVVKVYTYKDPNILIRELSEESVHKIEQIGFYSISPKFLQKLGESLERDNRWGMVVNDGTLTVNIGERSEETEIQAHLIR